MKEIWVWGAALLATSGWAAPGGQASEGPYLGAGVTRNSLDIEFSNGSSLERDDTSFRGFAGYAVSENLRLELGYVNFGDVDGSLEIPFPGPAFLPPQAEVEADSVTLGGELAFPLGYDFDLFIKGGVHFWEVDTRLDGLGVIADGEDPFYGLGLRLGVSENLVLIGAYERFPLDDVDIDVASFSVAFRF